MTFFRSALLVSCVFVWACDETPFLALEAAGKGPPPAASRPALPPASPPAVDSAPSVDLTASLTFAREGKDVRTITLAELLAGIPEETFTVFDPYYQHQKTFRSVPLAKVIAAGFAGLDIALQSQDFVLRASDGYTVPMTGKMAFEAGAYLAFADTEVPGWEPIGNQRANPGPFYLIWRGKDQEELTSHPRPWQLKTIGIARFADLFPHTYPTGEPEGSPAQRGFLTIKDNCIHCHAINREGGRVGPELNVPKSIVEYRPVAQIKAYVRNPLAFRYGNMPAHPHLSDADLDDLIAYFKVMMAHKFDPEQAP